MSEAQPQRKRKRQSKQMRQQKQPNSAQLQNDLVAYQAWLAEQLQYTAYLQHNGPVAQYLRQPPQVAGARREAPKKKTVPPPPQNTPPPAKTQRTVATWTCFEPDGPPRCYFSDRRWKSQVRSSAKYAEHQCPRIFRGRTVTASAPAIPPPPDSRSCEDCGGTVVDEPSHRRSRLHREAVEMDVSLICARIRRDPAFAAAVIAAARQCVERTGVEESSHSSSDNDDEVPSKRPNAEDDFEFLEGDVFKPASKN